MVDGVQQNQGTQGHGQGYLGSLKSVSPELIQDVTVVNGPFSAEYGDFSGLGVVHIRQRDRLCRSAIRRVCRGATSIQAAAFLAYQSGRHESGCVRCIRRLLFRRAFS